MHPVIAKTFGGLSTAYYFRQLFFALLVLALMTFVVSGSIHGLSFVTFLAMAINTLLYPYARFVYESIVGFIIGENMFFMIIGENMFFMNVLLMMFVKLITILICWSAAIFIAPIGLAYLYYHHSKRQE